MDPKYWLLDNRVIRRNLKRGAIALEAYEKELESLPDLEGEYEEMNLDADNEEEETDAVEAKAEEVSVDVEAAVGVEAAVATEPGLTPEQPQEEIATPVAPPVVE